MKVDGRPYRSIWPCADGTVEIIDQRWLPHEFRIARLTTREQAATAIAEMWVRGAPLIGATAAYGVALADAPGPLRRRPGRGAARRLAATRPTAVNLAWALAPDAGAPRAPGARRRAPRRRWPRRRRSATRTSRSTRRSAPTGCALIEAIAARQGRRRRSTS